MTAQQVYGSAIKKYESALDGSFRADNGVFYTDVSLAERIISDLRIPHEATILDPCCGTGSFLYAANKKQYMNLYGVDCDAAAVSLCAKYIPSAVLLTADSIGNSSESIISKLNLTRKLDYVIGNPPYAPIGNGVELNTVKEEHAFKDKVLAYGKNLFVAALIRSLELVKEGGIVSYIIPKNFLHVSSYSQFRKELLRDKTIVSIIDLGICFKDVRGEQIVLTIKNSAPTAESKIKLQKYDDGRFVDHPLRVPQSFLTDEILLFTCIEDFEIYKKLTSSYQTLNDLKGGYVGRGKCKTASAVAGKDIRKFGYKSMDLPNEGSRIFIQNIYSAESGIIAAFGGNLEAGETITVFTDGDAKMCRYILGILHSRLCNFFLYRYCYNNSRLTAHTDAKYLKKIPLPPFSKGVFYEILDIVSMLETEDYMSSKWLDAHKVLNKTIFQAYGIEKEQADYIDREMRAIQSKRWTNI